MDCKSPLRLFAVNFENFSSCSINNEFLMKDCVYNTDHIWLCIIIIVPNYGTSFIAYSLTRVLVDVMGNESVAESSSPEY